MPIPGPAFGTGFGDYATGALPHVLASHAFVYTAVLITVRTEAETCVVLDHDAFSAIGARPEMGGCLPKMGFA